MGRNLFCRSCSAAHCGHHELREHQLETRSLWAWLDRVSHLPKNKDLPRGSTQYSKVTGQSLKFMSRTHTHAHARAHTHIRRILCNDNVYLYISDSLFLSDGCQPFCFLQKKNEASNQNSRDSHGNKAFGSSLGSLVSSDYEASQCLWPCWSSALLPFLRFWDSTSYFLAGPYSHFSACLILVISGQITKPNNSTNH